MQAQRTQSICLIYLLNFEAFEEFVKHIVFISNLSRIKANAVPLSQLKFLTIPTTS